MLWDISISSHIKTNTKNCFVFVRYRQETGPSVQDPLALTVETAERTGDATVFRSSTPFRNNIRHMDIPFPRM